jgi:hypothetical protein
MPICTVLHPAVVLALTDGAPLLQHRDCPAVQRPDGRSPFVHHQHRDHSCRRILWPVPRSGLLTQGRIPNWLVSCFSTCFAVPLHNGAGAFFFACWIRGLRKERRPGLFIGRLCMHRRWRSSRRDMPCSRSSAWARGTLLWSASQNPSLPT